MSQKEQRKNRQASLTEAERRLRELESTLSKEDLRSMFGGQSETNTGDTHA